MIKFTQGVCEDGASILCDGKPLTLEKIIKALNRAERIRIQSLKDCIAIDRINSLCWESIASRKPEIKASAVIEIIEDSLAD